MSEEFSTEEAIFTIITGAGEARAKVFEALELAEIGKIAEARTKYAEADEDMHRAHKIQTGFIQQESSGVPLQINMLFVHAQDHLMTAMSEKGLIEKLITLHEKQTNLEQRLNALEQKKG
jgi:cellobiose PTS system EIIA component